ncbi:MAG: MATE family efflux transporter, partial [Oscillospiraceae bacterium]|nr:MATE family efflux transporter [Oscillospiraceae bacterium]
MASTNKYQMDMCSGEILPKIISFSLPLMFSSILQLLFNAADIVVVGRFAGDNSLAAVGSTSSLVNLIVNLFIGISVGANVTAARFYGAKRDDELHRTVHTSMMLSVISGIILTVTGFFGAQGMLELMSTPDEILPLASVYLRIYFLGMTPSMIYNFGSAILRAAGDTKRPMYYLLASGVINLILNLIFVIAFRMDVAGVALATVISQIVSATLIVRCLMKESGAIKLILKDLCLDGHKVSMILKIGIPAGFQGMMFSISNVVIQSSVNSFGSIVVAGNSAAMNIEGFVYVAMNSFYQSAISFVSQNYGAGQYKRIDKILLCSLACVTVAGLSLGMSAMIFSDKLLGIYSSSPEVIQAGVTRMNIIARTHFLCGIMDVTVGALRGIGRSVMPMIISLVCVCGLRLV